jgi:hypothetical protein
MSSSMRINGNVIYMKKRLTTLMKNLKKKGKNFILELRNKGILNPSLRNIKERMKQSRLRRQNKLNCYRKN